MKEASPEQAREGGVDGGSESSVAVLTYANATSGTNLYTIVNMFNSGSLID
jgi:hypothetical protein